MGVMPTSRLVQPSAATTVSASARDAGDDVRYGISTHSSLSAPIASLIRNATSAESSPPDNPSTMRSNPVCSRWPRRNSPMIWRATPVSMRSSSGSTYGAPAGAASLLNVFDPGALPQQPLELSVHQLRPLVSQQRQCHSLTSHV